MTEEIQSPVTSESCQSLYVVFAALIASIGGILFGYDIGIISGALLQLRTVFSLSSFEQELIVSGVLIGAFCASFFGGNIVDSWGRKAGIAISCGFFILGSLVLYFSVNFLMLVIGRFIVGIAVSLSVTAECTYISEISPPSRRGMMVSFNEVGITTGFLFAYLINYLFISTHNGWKYMFGVAVIPAIIQVLGMALMPNSHHYLLVKGKVDKARKVLSNLRSTDDVEEEIEAIITSIDEQKNHRYLDLFSSMSNMRGRMILGMTLVFLQQFSGNANVLYYAPTVFRHFGYSSDVSSTLVSVGLGVIKVVATVVTLLIVDKVGRRSLLLTGTLLMATSIITLGIIGTVNNSKDPTSSATITLHSPPVFSYTDSLERFPDQNASVTEKTEFGSANTEQNDSFTISNYVTPKTSPHHSEFMDNLRNFNGEAKENFTTVPDNQTTDKSLFSFKSDSGAILNTNYSTNENTTEFIEPVPFSTKIISVVSLMTFVCAYGMSYGPVTWLVLSEIFPGSLRGRAVSVATCINWGSNIIVSLSFLDILNVVGIGPTFIVYGFICYGAAIFIFFCVPETKNRTLEEINEALSKGMLRKNWKTGFTRKHRKYSMKNAKRDLETTYDSIEEKKVYDQLN